MHFIHKNSLYKLNNCNLASFYKVKTYSVESDVKWHEKLKYRGIKANYITVDLKVKKEDMQE